MRLLYTFRSLAVWGGIERVLVDKMNYFANMCGYDVYMLTTDQGDHIVPYHLEEHVHLEDLGIQFYKQYRYSGFRRLWDKWQRTRLYEQRLFERIRAIHPDVIVCTTADPVSSIVKVKGEIPLVVESHSICSRTIGGKDIRQRLVAKLLLGGLKHAACVVALTENDALEWRKFHPHVEVVPNMVHLNESQLSSLENKRVIWVGRLDYQKRPIEIIKIWQKVYPMFPDWHLNIYGEGEQLQEIENVINSLNMNIHIHQPTDRIFDAYRESSVLASTSLFEPFGLVIPEAMSCGLPVVAYNCPFGPSSILSDGNDGFLIQNNDQQAYADRLCQLMSDGALRSQMGKAASITSRRYEAKQIMPQWKTLFSQEVFGHTFLQKE